jgi:hypothetical protein
MLVGGSVGGVVVVMVSPVVTGGVDGADGSPGSAELTVLDATPSAVIATAALAPMPAETSLNFVENTIHNSVRYQKGPGTRS